jgi:arylsulfatase A-like enzyme
VALFDLSSMNTTDGPVRIRVYETTGETAVHRITLFEEGPAGPPNIIVIVVDDARYDEFELGFYRSVPGSTSVLETEFVDSGVEFKNYINTTPLCCPSRASYLTGQYAHNHNIWNNNYDESDPVGFGGIRRFYEDDRDLTSLGTWMQAAGYDTGLVGKYLNGYPDRQGMATVHGIGEDYVPRGWDEWYSSFLHDDTTHAPIDFSYEHFRFNENGSVVTYGPGAYLTDVEADLAVDFIDRNAGGSDPFFLYMAPYAPHGPTTARPDHYKIHKDLRVRPNPYPAPACNEGAPDAEDPDDSDKPQYIQDTVWDYGNCWGIGWL